MCASYRDKQKRSHFESFANKIFTGIRELNSEYAQKRAVWELFQNALDTVQQNGELLLAKTDKGLLFKHNGRPFIDDEFGGLIKQFSVGKTYGSNEDKLGQYGTGFISTHVYGKKIIVNCSIRTDDGSYRTLDDFMLDRDAENLDLLTDKLLEQDGFIERLCDDFGASQQQYLPYTSFEYMAGEENFKGIDSMLEYAESMLPYIFCFNDKLQKVTLIRGTEEKHYERKAAGEGFMEISIDGSPAKIPVLHNADRTVRIIMGAECRPLDVIPKQFLFYPLAETVHAGHNFIIHASDFRPNKERDYLHADELNLELASDVIKNESLVREAFDMVLSKVKNDESASFLDAAKVEFSHRDSLAVTNIKSDYITQIRGLERIDLKSGKVSIDGLEFFDSSVLHLDRKVIESAYMLLGEFRSLPDFDVYCDLSAMANNWNTMAEESFAMLTLADLGKIIAEESGGDYFYIENKEAYRKFISEISSEISLLNSLALIPNLYGEFMIFESLVKWEKKEEELIQVAFHVNATISEKYVHEDFEFLDNLPFYGRERFKEDFSKFCGEAADRIAKGDTSEFFWDVRAGKLIPWLVHFVGLNKKTALNIDIADFYAKAFKLEPSLAELADPTVDTNYQPAIKLLANLYVQIIKTVGIRENIDGLKEIIAIMYKNTNLKEEMLHKLECIPDQMLVLKSQAQLKKDDVRDEKFKDVYNSLSGAEIRSEIAYEGFEGFLQHGGAASGSEFGGKIEMLLNEEKSFIPIDNNTIDIVISLIERISEKPSTWGHWLPNINRVKEEIMMHKFQDENTRLSLFSILSVKPEKINILGKLAKIENLSALIQAGEEKLKEEGRKRSHLEHIKKIGLKIQDIIEKEIRISVKEIIELVPSAQDDNLKTAEEQNGQDFIIYKAGTPVYFIEVKSRWDVEGIVALSKRQTEKCAQNKGAYAVITVNVADYKSANGTVEDDVTFEDLSSDIYINTDLSEDFDQLIKQNRVFEVTADNAKLIEFRGHIPQSRIRNKGIDFSKFKNELRNVLTYENGPSKEITKE
ncbi:sacsin N-terminal ATP-binding-like domain-containing protein [Flavobacterium collinsii]|uniref:Protein NO VEIN C-terminal domain-containing protein n=1 Tax=Flavobacterium collinsii TaxID=1114861 RepID=A0ABM8KEQ1_9FLAO|nr:DUF3883 domain-containing protein [Flavobacterium collinsii]CAA9195822.1 hypothetical protein FLACOL7796_00815 [Flavobacterium collinsii]